MAFAFVQGKTAGHLATIAFAALTPTVNNVMVVFAFSNDAAATLTISDTQTNAWTASVATIQFAGGTSARMWWAISKNSSSTVITVAGNTASGSAGYAEYSGNETSSPADGAAGQSGTNNGAADNITSTTVTTTIDGDLIVSGVVNTNSLTAFGAGTGETNRATSSITGDGFGVLLMEDKIQGAHAAIAGTWTQAANTDTYIAIVQTIKVLAAAATGIPRILLPTIQAT